MKSPPLWCSLVGPLVVMPRLTLGHHPRHVAGEPHAARGAVDMEQDADLGADLKEPVGSQLGVSYEPVKQLRQGGRQEGPSTRGADFHPGQVHDLSSNQPASAIITEADAWPMGNESPQPTPTMSVGVLQATNPL